MYSNWNKSSIIAIVFASLLVLFASCKQSYLDLITHNDVGYWSRYWLPNDPHGMIWEYSKKDSKLKFIDEDWAYSTEWSMDDIYGRKFRVKDDTLFHYVDVKGHLYMRDTVTIVSISKNKIVIKNMKSDYITWHRLSTKYAKRQISKRKRGLYNRPYIFNEYRDNK